VGITKSRACREAATVGSRQAARVQPGRKERAPPRRLRRAGRSQLVTRASAPTVRRRDRARHLTSASAAELEDAPRQHSVREHDKSTQWTKSRSPPTHHVAKNRRTLGSRLWAEPIAEIEICVTRRQIFAIEWPIRRRRDDEALQFTVSATCSRSMGGNRFSFFATFMFTTIAKSFMRSTGRSPAAMCRTKIFSACMPASRPTS